MIAQNVFGILSALAVASAQSNNTTSYLNVSLVTESDNSTLADKYLTSVHEGAGINSVFLSNSSTAYLYDSNNNTILYPYTIDGMYAMILAEYSNTLTFSVTGEPFALVSQNNYLAVNGSSDVFYVCDSISFDPYHYSERSLGVSVYGSNDTIPESCQRIQIRCEPYNSTSSDGANGNSSASATATASHSATHTASHNSSITASHNGSHTASASGKVTSSHHNVSSSVSEHLTTTKTKHTVTIETATTLTDDDATYTYTAATTDVHTEIETITVSNAGAKVQLGAFGVLAALAAFV